MGGNAGTPSSGPASGDPASHYKLALPRTDPLKTILFILERVCSGGLHGPEVSRSS